MFEVSGRVQDARDEARPTRFMVKPVAPCCSSGTLDDARGRLEAPSRMSRLPSGLGADEPYDAELDVESHSWEP